MENFIMLQLSAYLDNGLLAVTSLVKLGAKNRRVNSIVSLGYIETSDRQNALLWQANEW